MTIDDEIGTTMHEVEKSLDHRSPIHRHDTAVMGIGHEAESEERTTREKEEGEHE